MRTRLRKVRRLVALGLTLAVTAIVVPDSGVTPRDAYLVRAETAQAIEHSSNVVWILLLGSDARPGQSPIGTRADAIQLVGLNLKTGSAVDLGIPRDSWVDLAGVGMSKINAGLFYGGPQGMAKAVTNLVGISPDYVFVGGFIGFKQIIKSLGSVTVQSQHTWSDDFLHVTFHTGKTVLSPANALNFARSRHGLPRGDFDRSADQQLLLLGILRNVLAHQDTLGFMERVVSVGIKNLYTNLSPDQLYHLAQVATLVNPAKIRTCVLNGGTGMVAGQSVVFPDVAEAHRWAADVRNDAKLNHGC